MFQLVFYHCACAEHTLKHCQYEPIFVDLLPTHCNVNELNLIVCFIFYSCFFLVVVTHLMSYGQFNLSRLHVLLIFQLCFWYSLWAKLMIHLCDITNLWWRYTRNMQIKWLNVFVADKTHHQTHTHITHHTPNHRYSISVNVIENHEQITMISVEKRSGYEARIKIARCGILQHVYRNDKYSTGIWFWVICLPTLSAKSIVIF